MIALLSCFLTESDRNNREIDNKRNTKKYSIKEPPVLDILLNKFPKNIYIDEMIKRFV